jgi:transposase
MGRKKMFTDEKVIEVINGSAKLTDAAKTLGVSYGYVANFMSRFRKTGNTGVKTFKRGAPKKVSK